MQKNNFNAKGRHASKETAYNPVDDSQITVIKADDVKPYLK